MANPPQFYAGYFVKTGTTQTVVCGFEPKGMIFFGSGQSAEGFAATDYLHFHGLSDGINHTGTSHFSTDNHATAVDSTGLSYSKTKCIVVADLSGVLVTGYVSAVTATGFVITWSNASLAGMVIGFAAVGGANVLAQVGFPTTRTTAGTQSVSVGFAPDAVIALSFAPSGSEMTSIGFGPVGVGFLASNGCVGANADSVHATPFDRSRYEAEGRFLVATGAAGVEYDASATLTGSGFDLSFSVARAGGGACPYLALKGVTARVGALIEPATSIACSGAHAKLVLVTSVGNIPASWEYENHFAFGVADRTRNVGAWAGDKEGVLPTECGVGLSLVSALLAAAPTTSSVTTESVATLVPQDNVVQVAWSSTSGSGKQSLYLILGGPDLDTTDITVVVNESTGCCDGGIVTTTKTAHGDVLGPVSGQVALSCAGGGAVPSAADLTDSENWA